MANPRKTSARPTKPESLRLPPDLSSDLSPVAGDELTELADTRGWQLFERSFTGSTFAKIELSSVAAEICLFDQVCLRDATIAYMRCRDLVFLNCDLSNLRVHKLIATRVEFKNCKLTGVRFVESECKDLLIEGGDQSYSQFRGSKIESAEFMDCNFEEADFSGAQLTRVKFSNCRLPNTEMTSARLNEVDLRGSFVEGLKLNAPDIRGAIVDPAQALIFAPLLGIRIC